MDYSNDSRVKKRKRALIVSVAMEMFYKCGIGDTSMFDVAKGSKIGRSTFYEYFNSKEELVGYVRKLYLEEICEELIEPSGDMSGLECLKAVMHGYVDIMISNHDAILFFFDFQRFARNHAMPDLEAPRVGKELYLKVLSYVDQGHGDGSLPKAFDHRSITIIWETLIGAAIRHAVKFDKKEMFKEAILEAEELHELVEILFAGAMK